MKKRRGLIVLVMAIISTIGVVLFFINDNLRNSRIQLGNGETIAEATAEATTEGDIPFTNPPSTLAFMGDVAGNWDIFVLAPDGTLTNLTADDPQYQDYFPSFALDGGQLNFLANRGTDPLGPSQVMTDGTDLKSLSVVEAIFSLVGAGRFDWDPAWSPNGTALLWSSLRDLNLELYVIGTDQEFLVSNATRLTNTGARDWFGAWSPDGKQIIFATDRDGNENLYVVSADGGDATALTSTEFDDIRGVWSLDGTQILYVYDDQDAQLSNGKLNLQIMNADGSASKPFEGVFKGDPMVTKDGSQVAYISNESGKWQIYVMNADGSNVRRVTPDDGNYLYPVWKP